MLLNAGSVATLAFMSAEMAVRRRRRDALLAPGRIEYEEPLLRD
jgi:hypothetical protein